MILVDTSLLIDYFKGRRTAKTEVFAQVLIREIPYGIAVFTYQELLQGARDELEFNQLRDYLGPLVIFYPAQGIGTYDKAAELFYRLRRQGVTVRSSIDMLIAAIAIENKCIVLHADRDFDAIPETF